jgi:hypothetical protein
MPDDEPPLGASRSFRKLVHGDDDLVGLVAYALYRIQKDEWARAATRTRDEVDRYADVLTPSQIANIRMSAESRLDHFAYAAIAAATPRIGDRVRSEGFDALERGLKHHVDQRTGWRHSLAANLAAWAITIGLTAVALVAVLLPSLAEIMAGRMVDLLDQTRSQ